MPACAAYGIEKGMNARVNVAVFDAKSLDKVWEKELDLQIPSQKGKVYNFAIDNNGVTPTPAANITIGR